MTGKVIEGVRFRKLDTGGPVQETLRDIAVDLDGEESKGAEIFALVRFPDGHYDVWCSATLGALDRVGALEAIKQQILFGDDGDVT